MRRGREGGGVSKIRLWKEDKECGRKRREGGGRVEEVCIPCELVVLSVLHCRQVDDLQFRLEEQGVISGDRLETTAEVNQRRLTQLEVELEEEKKEGQKLREQIQVRSGIGRREGGGRGKGGREME